MADNLLDRAIGQLGSGGIDALAKALNLPSGQGESALRSSFSYILAGMLNRASSKTGMGYLFNMISESEALDLSSLSSAVSDPKKLQFLKNTGFKMLETIFSSRKKEVLEVAGKENGKEGEDLLSVSAPIVTALMQSQAKSKNMDISDLASFLIGQREYLQGYIPDDLLKAIDVPNFDKLGDALVTYGHAKPQEPRASAIQGPEETKKNVSFSSWFFPLLLVLVALYALNMCMLKGKDEKAERDPSMTSEEASFMESASEPVGDSQLEQKKMAENLGPDKFSDNLRDYLSSFSREPNREFPIRVSFEKRTAKITNPSAADIEALAEIMQKKPNLSVAIEGHVKGEGNEIAEQEISQERADVVREILLQKGIAANRITATGMGSAKPFPEGEVEKKEQRGLNAERISVRVVNYEP
ncbi:OmpA family protein [Microbulbifer sp. OS29]|uniref:OmpA family protein n=1 Tax=Microbulbifer okhotskensis TaxID=2926617 RepID=A0A9X2EKP3_9GAMM|nr:OmpA family protein [Microbulbifer okhotskensis]MCO1333414.1 OmpA family protein [Microbulbifer okhotskensis]